MCSLTRLYPGPGFLDSVRTITLLMSNLTTSQAGFGLLVVKRMIGALNGTVTFDSKARKSMTFTVCFPKHKKR